MSAALKAHVREGRLVLDEPTSLPEGSEIVLIVGGGTPEPSLRLERGLFELAIAQASPEDLDHFARFIAELRSRPADELDIDEDERDELDRGLREAFEQAGTDKGVSTEEVFRSMNRAARDILSSS